MLIDSLAIKLSGSSRRDQLGSDQISLIDVGCSEHLQSLGWTRANSYAASATVFYQIFPTSPQSGTPTISVTCGAFPFLRFDGWAYSLYSPATDIPISSLSAGCQMVAMGATNNDTALNLAAAIKPGRISGLPWTASVVYDGSGNANGIALTCGVTGAVGNGWQAIPDGRFGLAVAATAGGGHKLWSVENLDSNGHIRTTQWGFEVRGRIQSAGDQTNPPTVYAEFKIFFDPSDATRTMTHRLDTLGQYWTASGANVGYTQSNNGSPSPGAYTMVANPYSVGFWDSSEDAGSAFDRKCSLFAAAPYIPTEEGFTAAKAVIVMNARLRKSTYWHDGYVTVYLDAPPAQISYTGVGAGYPRMLAIRAPGTTPLATPSGVPLIANAWVMFGKNTADTPTVVGKLWDCAVVNDCDGASADADGLMIAGQRYTRIARQDGSGGLTRSTLAFCAPQP